MVLLYNTYSHLRNTICQDTLISKGRWRYVLCSQCRRTNPLFPQSARLESGNAGFTGRNQPAFLGHLERGLKSPTIKTLEKIVHALDISLAELFADPQPVDNAKDAIMHRCATRYARSRSTIWSASTQSSAMFWQLGNRKFSAYNITNEVDIICPPRLFCDISCFGYSCCPLLTV